ncbi:hypothetical protein [Synechocystis sp. PCC 7509]|uniref:hypothetical protein n=1 Tax=Synechocystis sp. PCC 7509 TaxID=927677 RepID=UPI0002AC84A6|nr:hypothetical protein [Synechocystis sp. PCC 7509]
MTPADLEAALKAAFSRCDHNFCPLSEEQKEILLQVAAELSGQKAKTNNRLNNPLDELSPEQRQSFWQYIQVQEQQNLSWKAQLLNDWLQERDSGEMQFIRESYGFAWLNRIQPAHIAKYAQEVLKLKIGDRIEVANGLWEWVQENGPCSRQWFPCTVVAVDDTSCTIRFSNGAEYQIQGVYNWNRYNWRWIE